MGELLLAVLAENRRYIKTYKEHELKELELTETDDLWECSQSMRDAIGGLRYSEMVELARQAKFRSALWQMGYTIASPFRQVINRVPILQQLPVGDGPTWDELTTQWQIDKRWSDR